MSGQRADDEQRRRQNPGPNGLQLATILAEAAGAHGLNAERSPRGGSSHIRGRASRRRSGGACDRALRLASDGLAFAPGTAAAVLVGLALEFRLFTGAARP
jgi:hypothetical protein